MWFSTLLLLLLLLVNLSIQLNEDFPMFFSTNPLWSHGQTGTKKKKIDETNSFFSQRNVSIELLLKKYDQKHRLDHLDDLNNEKHLLIEEIFVRDEKNLDNKRKTFVLMRKKLVEVFFSHWFSKKRSKKKRDKTRRNETKRKQTTSLIMFLFFNIS